MRASTILFGLTATIFASAAVIPKEAATVKTAVSPDGYVYNVETEAYIEDTITTADGITHTVLVHPAFKRSVDEHGTSHNPNKSKRLQYTAGGADQCDHSTLVNKTSGASPTTGDCGAVRDYYRRDNGHFEASALLDLLGSEWCRLVITGTCVFGIKSMNVGGTKVGSSNIADLVEVSINTYQSGGRIGAEGVTTCTGWRATTQWAIFHS
ncbi:putative necrosis-inducing factor-domain-containing protein [Neurospora tetraspora]|uniref:Necrosis-inducing factor-domain-containing protein n=1 Tax=Neurospora tetraspora TaxID=94610 RepID=A0AAE0J909_9PEZI|nr:putative necrosis-inducing factor-domain-containing protein [Neurospora tetraspora]